MSMSGRMSITIRYPAGRRDGSTLKRRPEGEILAMQALAAAGFEKIPSHTLDAFGRPPEGVFPAWPASRRGPASWNTAARPCAAPAADRISRGFPPSPAVRSRLGSRAGPTGQRPFYLDMGIIVDGERLALAPLLAALVPPRCALAGQPAIEALPRRADRTADPGCASASGCRRAASSRWRRTLIDLFDGCSGGDTLRVSRFDAPRLAELDGTSRWQFKGEGAVLALADQFKRRAGHHQQSTSPGGLRLELRPYQTRRPGLAAVPARTGPGRHPGRRHGPGQDRAGARAHADREGSGPARPARAGGRCPTSVIANWQREAARFAPTCACSSLHGTDRAGALRRRSPITTWCSPPTRCCGATRTLLARAQFHLLILDEAQAIKNAGEPGARKVVRSSTRATACA